jgi:PPP family 3-phenylpropionic acid transporter
VVRHGLDYGPMRLWGSAAFIVGALVSGLLLRAIDSTQLIWPIVALAVLCALASFALVPLDAPPAAAQPLSRARGLLRKPLFLAIIAASALIQGSHAAYYAFSSITWQAAGLGGGTIAALWSLGVIAEIVVFAVSPRFTWSPASLVLIGAASGVVRWIVTAQEPGIALLAGVQLLHGFTFGITQVGIVALMAQRVPQHLLASAQGYLAAASGAAMSLSTIVSGLLYAQVGEGVYLAMALMALAGGGVIGWARPRLAAVHAI